MKRVLVAVVAFLLNACGSGGATPEASSNGGSNNGGANSAAGATEVAGAGNAGGSVEACPASPALGAAASARVALPIRVTASGVPLSTGQATTPASGAPYQLSMLKFFVSQPVLLNGNGVTVPAQLLDANGTPRTFGVQLIDLDDATSLALSLAAPPGDYTELDLGLGLPEPCNALDPTLQPFPLNADGDMYWTWGQRFMFIRIEGTSQVSGAWQPFTQHVGFQQNFRIAHLRSPLHTAGSNPSLQVDVDRLLNAPPGAAGDPAGTWVADNMGNNGALTFVP